MEFSKTTRMANVGEKYLSVQQEKINKINANGGHVINLGRGNPDQETFPDIVNATNEYLHVGKNHGYPPYGGKKSLKQEIQDFYQSEYQEDLEEDEITIFSGSTAALTALPMVLANPGDTVIAPTPAFFGYHIGTIMAGATEYLLTMTAENQYLPNLNDIPDDVKSNAKLMFLNYPHNPTGAGATRAFFDEVVNFGTKNHIAIVHDFAYADISFNKKAPSFLQSNHAKDVGIEIYTMSKTFNMAGWRLAFAVGNKSIIKLLSKYIQNSVGGTFGIVQDASALALKTQIQPRAELRDLYLTRRNAVLQELDKIGIKVGKSDGTFFVWAQLPEDLENDFEFAQGILTEQQVAVVPGSAFGQAGTGYFRISLVAPEETLRVGIQKIGKYIKQSREDD